VRDVRPILKADELLAAVRAEHQAFYRRIFQHRMVCAPRPYPLLAKPIGLMTIDYPAVAEQVHRRYPFFRSTLFERRMLFERAPVSASPASESPASESPVPANQDDRRLQDHSVPFVECDTAQLAG
jgi:N-acyl amino acid synthase FeeM